MDEHAAGDPLRLFIGTAVPADAVSVVQAAISPELSDPTWNWTPLSNWHVTVLFLGAMPSTSVAGVVRAVQHCATGHLPLQLHEGRLVDMPLERPHMRWLRFRPCAALTALHLKLAEELGVEPSRHRPYWPHITLGRTRKAFPGRPPGDPVLPLLELRELTLFRSDPGPGGMVHRPLYSAPFVPLD
jgi:RNA 2',3'-cyclic 3'-phosphodiesterase